MINTPSLDSFSDSNILHMAANVIADNLMIVWERYIYWWAWLQCAREVRHPAPFVDCEETRAVFQQSHQAHQRLRRGQGTHHRVSRLSGTGSTRQWRTHRTLFEIIKKKKNFEGNEFTLYKIVLSGRSMKLTHDKAYRLTLASNF